MNEWQPIESAPRENDIVWLCEGGAVYQGFYSNKENYYGETGWYDTYYLNDLWYSEHPANPSHWMPITPPDPPK